jgi:hypothetical protein
VRLTSVSILFSIVWAVLVIVKIVESIVDVVSTFSSIRGKCGLWSLVRNESTFVLFSISSSSEGFSSLFASSLNSLIILGSCTWTRRGRSVVSIGIICWSLICVWVSSLISRSMVGDFWEVSTWGSSGFNDVDDSSEWSCPSIDCSIVDNVDDGNVESIVSSSVKGKLIN